MKQYELRIAEYAESWPAKIQIYAFWAKDDVNACKIIFRRFSQSGSSIFTLYCKDPQQNYKLVEVLVTNNLINAYHCDFKIQYRKYNSTFGIFLNFKTVQRSHFEALRCFIKELDNTLKGYKSKVLPKIDDDIKEVYGVGGDFRIRLK